MTVSWIWQYGQTFVCSACGDRMSFRCGGNIPRCRCAKSAATYGRPVDAQRRLDPPANQDANELDTSDDLCPPRYG